MDGEEKIGFTPMKRRTMLGLANPSQNLELFLQATRDVEEKKNVLFRPLDAENPIDKIHVMLRVYPMRFPLQHPVQVYLLFCRTLD